MRGKLYVATDVLDNLIAMAGRCFKALPVENFYFATTVANQLALLQGARGLGNADATDTKRGRKEFMRKMKFFCLQTITRHQ